MFERGIVSEIDGDRHRVRVMFPHRRDVTSPWLDVPTRATHLDRDYWLPALGTMVAVLLDEHGEEGSSSERCTPRPIRWTQGCHRPSAV